MAFALGTTTGAGTISIAAGGTVVTGVGTNFQAANVGAIIVVGSQWGVIATRTSTTSITIDRPFTTAVTTSAYQISANIPVITQTGTDTSLSTLTGVPGVTVSTNLWTITSATLVINGSLTINRLTNRLRFLNPANLVTLATSPPTFTIGATGSFNNSVAQSLNGYTYRSPNYSIMFDGVVPTFNANPAALIATTLGSTSIFEGNIEFFNLGTNSVLTFNFEGTTTLQYGALLNSSATGANILFYVANGSSNLTLNNYTSVGISLRIANNTLTLNNYAAIAGPNAININTPSAINNAQYVGLQSLGSNASIRTAASSLKYFQLINYSDTALVPTSALASNTGSQVLIVNQLRLTATGTIGNIPNVKFWAKDSNNGSRSPSNYGVGQAYEIATTGDLIYQTTTAGTGIAPTLNVISVIYWQPTASTTTIDYRGNNGAQDLNIYQCAYNYVLSNSLTNLWPLNNGIYGGTQVRNQGFALLQDTAITEQVMATVAAYTTINNNAELYDFAKYYLYTNFAGQTATYVTGTGDAGSYNVIVNQSAVNPFTPSGSSLAIKSANFTGDLTTSGSVILANASIISDNIVDAPNVIQDIPTDFNGVTITGNLTYNTNTPITVTFTDCDIQGTVNNTGSGDVVINLLNSTIGTVGIGVTSRLVTNFTINGLASDSQIYIADGDGTQVEYVASSGTSYSLDTTGGTGDWTYKVAKYGFITQEGIFTPETSSTTITVTLLVDIYVVDILPNVIAYTDLNSTQKITDYASYYGTTNAGIIIGSVLSKGFGTLTVPAGLTLNPTAVVLFAVSSGVVTTKSSGLDESVTIISSGNFTQGTATLSNDVIIRASNLDSEVIYNADSITFYPTLADRNAGSNPGVTTTGGIYRFKYASTYSGVTMIGTLYIRIQEGLTTISPPGVNIIIGSNTIDTSVQGQLSSIKSDISLIPQDTWEYENRTLNNALFE